MSEWWEPVVDDLRALNEKLKRAHREGIERGGAPCCGSTGVEHLPFCSTGKGVDPVLWLRGGRHDGDDQ